MASLLHLLDLSAAFDTLDLSTMLKYLGAEAGIMECAMDWFK